MIDCLSDDVVSKMREVPHEDMDVYNSSNGDGFEWDFRAIINGSFREDTRSRVILDNNQEIEMFMVRLPPVENAEKQQDEILRIGRRHFDKRAGCYGRSGNLHVKYPVTGQLFGYKVQDFLEDYKGFKEEIEQKINFKNS